MPLPEFVVIRMGHKFVPAWKFSVEVFRVGVGQRPQAQEKIVKVGAIEWKSVVLRGSFHQRSVLERVAQSKRAVMKKIVAQPRISHASLLGSRFQGRMRVDH